MKDGVRLRLAFVFNLSVKVQLMFRNRLLLSSLVLSTCLMGAVSSASAQWGVQWGAPQGESGVVIERVDTAAQQGGVFELLQKGRVQGVKIENLATLRDFYAQRNFEPYWVDDDEPDDNAEDMLEYLEESWTHGLNPFRYHLEAIRSLYDQDGDEAAMQALEILLSDAYIAYGQDLTGIRVNPAAFKSSKRFWQKPYTPSSLTDLLQHDNDADDVVEGLWPRGSTYNRLRKELISLVDETPEPYEAVLPIKMRGLLRPYEEHRSVQDLRVRFDVDIGGGSLVYDDRLAAKVMAFQQESGLEADGVIGPATLRAINKTRKQKIHQIIANLERLRWVEEAKPDKFVIVNIPSAMLWAVEDGRVAFDMPVIVGRKKRPTNIFITEITGVRLNPTWTVPPTIKREDILPKLIEDGNYLKRKGMELVHGRGKDALTLDPTAIDWTTVTEAELKSLRMIQTPGAHNPLGSVRVLMPNGYNIYLHDTNEKHYFNKPGRAVSSGCIRLKRPLDMAQFILKNKPGWDEDRTDEVLGKGKIRDIFIPETIPVYLVYYTAWIDEDDEIVFGNDLYDYDAEMIKMLSNLDEIFIPVDNTGISTGYRGRSGRGSSKHNL